MTNKRSFNLRGYAFISSLLMGLAAAAAGCGSGSTSPASGSGGAAGGNTGSGGAGVGTGGSGVGTGGSGVGTGGSGVGTGGSGVGTGGSTGAGGTGGVVAGPSVCDGLGTRVLTMDQGRVDNFEGAVIHPGWFAHNDVMPTPHAFKILQQPGGAIATANGGHYAGMGIRTVAMGGFGAGVSFNLAVDRTAMIFCVDISAFDGVTFWAKAATAGAKVDLNFIIPATQHMMDGGDCMTACYNHPRKTVTLTATWAQYSVTFAEGLGGSARVAPANRLQGLGWLTADATFDFWIDEIQLYKGTPPTTPVPPAI